jgi:hypothetical protein
MSKSGSDPYAAPDSLSRDPELFKVGDADLAAIE